MGKGQRPWENLLAPDYSVGQRGGAEGLGKKKRLRRREKSRRSRDGMKISL